MVCIISALMCVCEEGLLLIKPMAVEQHSGQ